MLPCNGSCTKIGSVKQADTVKASQCDHQTHVNTANNGLLLFFRDSNDTFVIGQIPYHRLNMITGKVLLFQVLGLRHDGC